MECINKIQTEQAMLDLGKQFTLSLKSPSIIYLKGQLGAGKTTFVRGGLRGLGYTGIVKSPTYSLVESYDVNEIKIFHMDLYRLHNPEELEFTGIQDDFKQNALFFVEWAEQALDFLPEPNIIVRIEMREDIREVVLENLTGLRTL